MIIVVAAKSNFELFYDATLRRRDIREETLVIGAFVEFVNSVNRSHGRDIAKHNLIWSDTHDGTIHLEELLNGLTLAEANDVDVKPEV